MMVSSTSQTDLSADTANRPTVDEAQIRQAEELLFSGPQTISIAKALFHGELLADQLFPYPRLPNR